MPNSFGKHPLRRFSDVLEMTDTEACSLCLHGDVTAPASMEFILAGCLVFPISALWLQSLEDDEVEEEFDFL